MIVEAICWVILGAIMAAWMALGARLYLKKRMVESFELGMKMGRGLALMPDFQVKAWLDEAGIDASGLPGFEQ